MRSQRAVIGLVLALIPTLACYEEGWQVPSKARAPDAAVAIALGDTGRGAADVPPDSVPLIPPPAALRPCCAFGVDLEVAVGRVPVPGVEIGNVTGREKLGPHRFDNGFISLNRHDSRGWVDDEGNGLVYSCRGGPLDTAHVAELDRLAWERGAIVYARGTVLRLAPPLCITAAEVDQLVSVVADSIADLEKKVG